jgi:hypothetical protein
MSVKLGNWLIYKYKLNIWQKFQDKACPLCILTKWVAAIPVELATTIVKMQIHCQIQVLEYLQYLTFFSEFIEFVWIYCAPVSVILCVHMPHQIKTSPSWKNMSVQVQVQKLTASTSLRNNCSCKVCITVISKSFIFNNFGAVLTKFPLCWAWISLC